MTHMALPDFSDIKFVDAVTLTGKEPKGTEDGDLLLALPKDDGLILTVPPEWVRVGAGAYHWRTDHVPPLKFECVYGTELGLFRITGAVPPLEVKEG